MFKDFKIILPLPVREKIQYFVDKADKEISGLGDATVDMEQKVVTVHSAFLLDQVCTSTTTDLDEDAVSKAMFQAHKDEQEGHTRSIRFWWHSHVNMGVFWSATDTATMKELSEHGWFCNIVFNKKREMLGALSYPIEMKAMGVTTKTVNYTSDIPIFVPSVFTREEKDAMDNEMKEKYKEKTYTTYNSNSTYGNKGWTNMMGLPTRGPKGDAMVEGSMDWYESVYGPMDKPFDYNSMTEEDYDNIVGKSEYEIGEKLPDGSVSLYWGEFIQVVCYEGKEQDDHDDVWFRTRATEDWVPVKTCVNQLQKYQFEYMSLDAIEAIYLQLDDMGEVRRFKSTKNLVTKVYNAKMKEHNREVTLLPGMKPNDARTTN